MSKDKLLIPLNMTSEINSKTKFGFTVIELIAVIAFVSSIAITTVAFVTTTRQTQSDVRELQSDVHELQSDVRGLRGEFGQLNKKVDDINNNMQDLNDIFLLYVGRDSSFVNSLPIRLRKKFK